MHNLAIMQEPWVHNDCSGKAYAHESINVN